MATMLSTVRFEIRLGRLAFVELWFWRLLTYIGFEPTEEAFNKLAKRHVRIKEVRVR